MSKPTTSRITRWSPQVQPWPRIGLVCPRCAGQVVRTHPDDDASCLWCGFAPLEGAVMAAGAAA